MSGLIFSPINYLQSSSQPIRPSSNTGTFGSAVGTIFSGIGQGSSGGLGSMLMGGLTSGLSLLGPVGAVAGGLASGLGSIIPGFQGFLQTGSLSCIGNQALDEAGAQNMMAYFKNLAEAGQWEKLRQDVEGQRNEKYTSACSKIFQQKCVQYGEQLLGMQSQQSQQTQSNAGLQPLIELWNGFKDVQRKALQIEANKLSQSTGQPLEQSLQNLLGGIFNGSIRIDENGVVYDVNLTNQKQPNYLGYAILFGFGLLAYKIITKK